MRATTLLQRTAILISLVAIAVTSVQAQGPSLSSPNGWPYGGGGNPSNPGNSDDNNNNNNNNDDDGNGDSSSNDNNDGSTSNGGSSTGNNNDSNNNNNGDGNGDGANGDGFGGNGGGNFGNNNNNNGNNNNNNNGGSSSDFWSGPGSFGDGLEYPAGLRTSYGTAHGILAATAFALLFPLGGILVRVLPGGRRALAWHAGVQVLAYALYVAAAGLGLYLVAREPGTDGVNFGFGAASGGGGDDDDDDDDGSLALAGDAHPIIGIALLVVLSLQPVWGVLHHRRFAAVGRRTWASYVHLWAGRSGVTLGIVNGGLGLALARRRAGEPVVVAYAVVAGLLWLLWLLAAAYGRVARKRAGTGTGTAEDERRRASRKEEILLEDRGAHVPAIRGGGGGDGDSGGGRRRRRRDGDSSSRSGSSFANLPPATNGSATVAAAAAAMPVSGSGGALDIPSPPYTPGPHYEAHMAHIHQQQQRQQQQQQQPARGEMQSMKEVMDRSDSVSILSALQDEMHRGQV